MNQYNALAFTSPKNVDMMSMEYDGAAPPGHVRGRTLVSLISPGTELAWNYDGGLFPNYPGYAAVLEIGQIGAGVSGFEVGQKLFTMGPHQSLQQTPVELCVPLPAGLDPARAVVARLMGVSMTALRTTEARPGDTVLVTGMGPVGYCAACNFAAAGYRVHAVEPDEARRSRISHPGILALHSVVPLDSAEMKGKVALVLECSGHEQAALDGAAVLRKGGELVLVGVPWKRRTGLYLHDLLHAVFHNYIHLRSGWEWELPLHETDFRPWCIFSGFRLALDWLGEGKIPLDGLVVHIDPRDAQRAYDDCANGRAKGLFQVMDGQRGCSRFLTGVQPAFKCCTPGSVDTVHGRVRGYHVRSQVGIRTCKSLIRGNPCSSSVLLPSNFVVFRDVSQDGSSIIQRLTRIGASGLTCDL